MPRGAVVTDQAGDSPPYVVLVLTIILGAVGIVAAYGVWRAQRWGVILTIILRVVDSLSALPGLLSPNVGLQLLALTGITLSALVIFLLLRRDTTGDALISDSSAS